MTSPPPSELKKPKYEEKGITRKKKDSIYKVCLRKSRIESQLKERT